VFSEVNKSLDLKTDVESLMRTVCGGEFQTDGAESRKARLEKSVLVDQQGNVIRITAKIYCYLLQVTHPAPPKSS